MKPYFIQKAVLFFLLMGNFLEKLEGATLHCVLAGDTLARDVGSPVLLDLIEMEIFVKDIGRNLGFKNSIKRIQGKELSLGNFYEALYAIPSTEEDVIIFYYSGHGFRFPDEEGNPWPQFYFSFPNEAASFLDVKTVLNNKPFKTLLVITDCCNSIINNSKKLDKKEFDMKAHNFSKNEKKNLKLLFLEKKKRIYVTAAIQSSYAYCNQRGGIYTRSFFKAFKNEVSKVIFPSWENLLKKSKGYTQGFEILQTPYYEIEY